MNSGDSLEQLQLLFMDHEKSIETMSELIRRQEAMLGDLAGRIETLEARIRDLSGSGATETMADQADRPPHY